MIIAAFAASSLFTRATTGAGLRAAELEAATAEMDVLLALGASEEKKAASAQKAADLANGPADLLDLAEKASLASALVAALVVGYELGVVGSLPSAVPVAGAVCWS